MVWKRVRIFASLTVDGVRPARRIWWKRCSRWACAGLSFPVFAESLSPVSGWAMAYCPKKTLSEEGASRHYWEDAQWAAPDAGLYSKARSFFSARGGIALQNTVTTDAVYRQTFKKEAYWREMGCAGVDMEGSAVLNVARYLGMEAVALFMASDAHPLTPDAPKWDWSLTREQREAFALQCMEFAMSL